MPFHFAAPSLCLALQPRPARSAVWAVPLSLATTRRIVSFPLGTKMFQFPRFPSPGYVFTRRCAGIPPRGFPHSDISGSAVAHTLPELFAVYHVLHRQLAPRHPPCALSSLSSCDAENLILSRSLAMYALVKERVSFAHVGRMRSILPLAGRRSVAVSEHTSFCRWQGGHSARAAAGGVPRCLLTSPLVLTHRRTFPSCSHLVTCWHQNSPTSLPGRSIRLRLRLSPNYAVPASVVFRPVKRSPSS